MATATQTTKPTTTAPKVESRNFLVAFLLELFLGYFGIHQIYLGRKTQGWTRFSLGIASFPLMVALVGFAIFVVLFAWAIVDFFLVYLGKKVDGEGNPLAVTARDALVAKVLFVFTLVYSAFTILGLVLLALTGLLGVMNSAYQMELSRKGPTTYDPRYR